MAQQKLPKAGWFLPLSSINDIQAVSVAEQVKRTKQAHHTDLDIRINGQNESHQADWVKHLQAVDLSPPEPRRIYHMQVGDIKNIPTPEQLHDILMAFTEARKSGTDGVISELPVKVTEIVFPSDATLPFSEPIERYKPHEVRVLYEVAELDDRLGRLESFVHADNKVFMSLPEEDRELLEEQLSLMAQLSSVLHRRIARFQPSEE